MAFSRQEYWSGLPFNSPGDLSDLVIEPRSLALQEDALPSEPPGKHFKIDTLISPFYRWQKKKPHLTETNQKHEEVKVLV